MDLNKYKNNDSYVFKVAVRILMLLLICIIILAIYLYFNSSVLTAFLPGTSSPKGNLERIKMPQGFDIGIFAAQVEGARSLVLSDSGTLFVGTRSQGKVYAVIDKNKDHKVDRVITIASGLNSPNGVALKDGSLYVAEIDKVLKFENIQKRLEDPPAPKVVSDNFPDDVHHGWKFIRFGPDGKLYVPIGAPCNVCLREDKRFASITRMDPDGSDHEIFAGGIRNTVGFDWHPKTGVMWFTDNGRDWMGDNKPPDELNRAPKEGLHFGFPYCHGKDIQDTDHKGKSCKQFIGPELELGPHVAALGMRFYTGNMFPEKYRGGIFIAEHGSWNRSDPIGYRITFVKIKDGKAMPFEIFASGWLQSRTAWGRPVDVELMPDGSMLVSDDKSGTIYRITYKQKG